MFVAMKERMWSLDNTSFLLESYSVCQQVSIVEDEGVEKNSCTQESTGN